MRTTPSTTTTNRQNLPLWAGAGGFSAPLPPEPVYLPGYLRSEECLHEHKTASQLTDEEKPRREVAVGTW